MNTRQQHLLNASRGLKEGYRRMFWGLTALNHLFTTYNNSNLSLITMHFFSYLAAL